MSQEAEKISNYESEAVQKNKAAMKSKFAERYQRMQDRKNDRGVAPNFNTFVTNAVEKTSVAKKTSFSVASMCGPTEIQSAEQTTYTIESYTGEPTEEQKLKVKWCVFIKGRWISLTNIEEREDPKNDPLVNKTRYREAILYCKIEADKATLKFSKWLDGKTVTVEAYKYTYGDTNCQQNTKVTAKPEVLSINWINAKEQKIATSGYDQDVFLEVETLGMKGKELTLQVWDHDKGAEDDQLDWGANSIKITGRTTLKQFPIKKKADYGLQQQDENKPGLDLYVVVSSSEPLENCKDKYATYLDLNPNEKIITAYFAEELKKEVQKGEEKPKPKPKKETPKESTTYTVVSGDHDLGIIADKLGIPWIDIFNANPGMNWGEMIPKKTILTIPPKKEEAKPKEKEKDTKTITYYQKIDSASLGSEVHLIAETQNLEGKTVTFKVFEKEPTLLDQKDTPIPLLINNEEKTEIETTVQDGKAQVKVALKRRDDCIHDEWKEKLSPQEKQLDNIYLDTEKKQSVFMQPFDLRLVTHPDRYTPATETIPAKKTQLWLQVVCEGDQLDFDGKFLHKNRLEVSLNTGDHGDYHDPIINPQVRGWYNPSSTFNKNSSIKGWNPYASMKMHKHADKIENKKVRMYGDPQRGGRGHQGLDIYAPVGTPVYACVDGKITMHRMTKKSAGFKIKLEGQYKGKHIRFNYIHLMQFEKTRFRFYNQNSNGKLGDHGWLNYNDFATAKQFTDPKKKEIYTIHYDNGILKIDQNEIDVELALKVTRDLDVKKGQIIGYTGSTGNSYQGKKANHLHFNTYINWKSVLPYEQFKEYFGLDISGAETSKKQDGVTPSSKW